MRRTLFEVVASGGRLVAVAFAAALLGGTGAYVATTWIIAGSSAAQIQTVTVSNLTISAVSSSAATNVPHPSGKGDVVVTISNSNPYPVTVTAVNLPTSTTYAAGYTTSTLTTAKTGCLSTTPSGVIWAYSTPLSGTSHTLTTALTVAASGQANNPLTVTFSKDARMTTHAPADCEDTYFSMPAFTWISVARSPATVTTSPASDSWTS
ncbi:MAG: hypothetical protein ABSD85_06695 [Acidimicrobiales bacterium]|jgi:hypothetical protein